MGYLLHNLKNCCNLCTIKFLPIPIYLFFFFVLPGITRPGYFSPCGPAAHPVTRPGGRPRLATPPAHDYWSLNSDNNLIVATHWKNIKSVEARENTSLNLTSRICLTVTIQYRLNQYNSFRLLIIHTTVYKCLQLSIVFYNVLHRYPRLALDTRLFNVDKA